MLYINRPAKLICVTVKDIKCPENIAGVGKSPYPEGMIKYETPHFLNEGFTKVTTKKFKDSLKTI